MIVNTRTHYNNALCSLLFVWHEICFAVTAICFVVTAIWQQHNLNQPMLEKLSRASMSRTLNHNSMWSWCENLKWSPFLTCQLSATILCKYERQPYYPLHSICKQMKQKVLGFWHFGIRFVTNSNKYFKIQTGAKSLCIIKIQNT